MAGFTDILGTLIQDGLSQSSRKRVGKALGAGGGGSLNDIINGIGEMLGGGGKSQAGGGLGGMLAEVMQSLGSNKAAMGGLGALGGALLAIEVDTQAEKQYMQKLADGLRLAPETVSYLEQSLAK